MSKSDCGIDGDAGAVLDDRGQRALVVGLDAPPLVLELGVARPAARAGRALLEIGHPALADVRVISALKARIAQRHPAPRRDAVGDVDELLRHDAWKSRSTVCFSSSVCSAATPLMAWLPTHARWAMRTYRSPSSSISDSRCRSASSPGKRCAHLVEEPAVDLVDDLEMARQQRAEQRHRPFLERLGEQRVVRVAAGLLRDRPRPPPSPCRARRPAAASARRPRSTDGCRSAAPPSTRGSARAARPRELLEPDHVLQRARDEEVLLRQPQLLAGVRLVVRIEHLGDRFGRDLLLDRTVVIADIERLEVERFGRLPLSTAAAGWSSASGNRAPACRRRCP